MNERWCGTGEAIAEYVLAAGGAADRVRTRSEAESEVHGRAASAGRFLLATCSRCIEPFCEIAPNMVNQPCPNVAAFAEVVAERQAALVSLRKPPR